MAQQREAQIGVVGDAVESVARGLHRLVDGVGAAVGQFGSFDVAPQAFDRVEFGGVAGQAFDAQPAAARRR